MSTPDPHQLIYASQNGDHWYLLFDPKTGHSFVQHTGNMESGGYVTDFGIATFLASGRNGPSLRNSGG